jgi:hypothetical protein
MNIPGGHSGEKVGLIMAEEFCSQPDKPQTIIIVTYAGQRPTTRQDGSMNQTPIISATNPNPAG